jgi:hypothetical protein
LAPTRATRQTPAPRSRRTSSPAIAPPASEEPPVYGDGAGYVLVGPVAGAAIGAWLGWFSVPNAFAPSDTMETHRAAAAAAGLAALVCAALLTPSAYRRPLRDALLMFVGTYVLGCIAFVVMNPPAHYALYQSLDTYGLLGAFVPWIAAATILWSTGMYWLGSVGRPKAPGISRLQWRKRLPVALLALAVVSAVFVTVAPRELRGMGLSVPDAPVAHRPSVVGVVADAASENGSSVRVRLEDGREMKLKGSYPPVPGGLLLVGSDGQPWFVLPPDRLNYCPGQERLWPVELGYAGEFVWDRGDSILFPDGLELPKASGFSVPSWDESREVFRVRVYPPDGWLVYCVNERGEVEQSGRRGSSI